MIERISLTEIGKNPTILVIGAAMLSLVLLVFVSLKIESMRAAEQTATDDTRHLEKVHSQIILYGEILTNAVLMAAVTGNESWTERFKAHQPLLEQALANMSGPLEPGQPNANLTKEVSTHLLEFEYKAIALIQENRADEARRMLFSPAYQTQKKLSKQSLADYSLRVDQFIHATRDELDHSKWITQQVIIVTFCLLVLGWALVLRMVFQWQREIKQLAYFDPLTNLASRRYFMLKIEEAIKLAHRRSEGFTLLFMDLDGFKDINDSMGHDVGDQLLREIATRLQGAFRETDFIARLGGDEFCVLLERVWHTQDVELTVQRCLERIEQPVQLSERMFRPRASIGVARYPEDGTTPQLLIKSADSAMYCAKNNGKHRFEYYSAELTEEANERLALVSDLREAFVRNEFVLQYQPIINLTSGLMVGAEALVRWHHPDRGVIPPLEFIPQLESMGMIDTLGEWVLATACHQVFEWTTEGNPLKVSVNISPKHFLAKDFGARTADLIQNKGVNPQQVILEVTESTFQEGVEISDGITKLRALGVQIAMDDFGTGYSSLSSLKHLPIDIIKIDRTFVQHLLNSTTDSIILGTIMGMTHALELTVIAEGVEENGQVLSLRALNCDLAQGFHFSKPVSSKEISALADVCFLPPTQKHTHAI